MLNPNENGVFETLYKFVHQNENKEIYKLIFSDGKEILARYNTDYESDNGLDSEEEGYEEFISIVFENQETKELFELNYHTIPKEMYYGNSKVF